MKKSIHPGVAIVLVVAVVVAAVFYIIKGMEPQRETHTMSMEEINKQMQNFNQRMSGGQGGGTSASPAPGAHGAAASGTSGK